MGLLGICGFSLVFGLIFGVIALVQIGRTQQTGRGLAITGIVASFVWILILTVGIVMIADRTALSGTAPVIVALQPGACYEKPSAFSQDAAAVDCSAPHDGEVFDLVPLAATAVGDGYPGGSALTDQARPLCEARRTAVFGAGFSTPVDVAVAVFYPDEASWQAGGRNAVCTLQATGDQLTGALRR